MGIYTVILLAIALATLHSIDAGMVGEFGLCEEDHEYFYNSWYIWNDETNEADIPASLPLNDYCVNNDTYSHLRCAMQQLVTFEYVQDGSGGCDVNCSKLFEIIGELNNVTGMPLCIYGIQHNHTGYPFEYIVEGEILFKFGSVLCADREHLLSQCNDDDGDWSSKFLVAEMGEYEDWGEYSDCEPCNDGDTDGNQTHTRTCSQPMYGGFTCEELGKTDLSETRECDCTADDDTTAADDDTTNDSMDGDNGSTADSGGESGGSSTNMTVSLLMLPAVLCWLMRE